MSELEDFQAEALLAYSKGELSWRRACAKLGLMGIEELQAMMEEHGYHLPSEDADPQDDEDAQKLTAFLKGGGYGGDE